MPEATGIEFKLNLGIHNLLWFLMKYILFTRSKTKGTNEKKIWRDSLIIKLTILHGDSEIHLRLALCKKNTRKNWECYHTTLNSFNSNQHIPQFVFLSSFDMLSLLNVRMSHSFKDHLQFHVIFEQIQFNMVITTDAWNFYASNLCRIALLMLSHPFRNPIHLRETWLNF